MWHYCQVPAQRTFWLDLFTQETWGEFEAAGAKVTGFSGQRWKTVQRMEVGDYLLCYLVGVSRWIAILEVTGPAFHDESPIWSSKVFPSRIPVQVVAALTPDTAVPVLSMRETLSIFSNLKNPNFWSGPFRGSPAEWKKADGEAVVAAVREAQDVPIVRPIERSRLESRPSAVVSSIGVVTLPDDDEDEEGENRSDHGASTSEVGDSSAHTEMQYHLLKFGSEMGLDVWVARNDKGRSWRAKAFADIPRLRKTLPQQFDSVTNRTIELIDVLWLRGNAIVAAFEVESTTSVYSGLLRMADLLALQPNLNIPLFIVAPEGRRTKVISEINRPTFSQLKPPLVNVCRLMTFEKLQTMVKDTAEVVQHLRPDVLQEFTESCEVDAF